MRKLHRVMRHKPGTIDNRSATDGIQHIGRECEVQHLFENHAPQDSRSLLILTIRYGIKCAQIGRNGGVLQFNGDLKVLAKIIQRVNSELEIADFPKHTYLKSSRMLSAAQKER